MGFEYRGTSTDGAWLDWPRVREAIASVPDFEIVGSSQRGVVFVLRSEQPDRSRWKEDGRVELVHEEPSADGSLRAGELYLLFHAEPHADVIRALESALAERGLGVVFDDL